MSTDEDTVEALKKIQSLPFAVDVQKLATIRANELKSFHDHIGPSTITARAITGLQRLPVKLRRRAASQNPKRLPRRLHRLHPLEKNNIKEILAKKVVKKSLAIQQRFKYSRRQRRKNHRLRVLSQRRTSSYCESILLNKDNLKVACWLPTHLWHTKRYFMRDFWSWKIPLSSTDKNFKSCQTSASERCIFFDISYISCIQIQGVKSHIEKTLFSMCTLLSHDPKRLYAQYDDACVSFELNGLLHSDIFDNKEAHWKHHVTNRIICPVKLTFLKDLNEENFILWLWMHPSAYKEGYEVISNVFLKFDGLYNEKTTVIPKIGDFCRFSLRGKLSQCILNDAITSSKDFSESKGSAMWNYINKHVVRSANVPKGLCIPIRCIDFKLNKPKTKLHNQYWISKTEAIANEKMDIQLGLKTFSNFTEISYKDGEFSELFTDLKENALNEATLLKEDDCFSYEFPIILIQNGTEPLEQKHPTCIGWDVIMPRFLMRKTIKDSLISCHPKDFLVACVYRGVEVGGLRDYLTWAGLRTDASAAFETFPFYLWQDTSSGTDYRELINKKLNSDKNVNLNSMNPDNPLIKLLLSHLSDVDVKNLRYFILRDTGLLLLLAKRMIQGERRARFTINQLNEYNQDFSKAYIPVIINCVHKGKPVPWSKLYAPENFKQISEFKNETKVTSLKGSELLVGYVTDGSYNHGKGFSSGLGLVSMAALSKHLTKSDCDCGITRLFMVSDKNVVRVVELDVVTY